MWGWSFSHQQIAHIISSSCTKRNYLELQKKRAVRDNIFSFTLPSFLSLSLPSCVCPTLLSTHFDNIGLLTASRLADSNEGGKVIYIGCHQECMSLPLPPSLYSLIILLMEDCWRRLLFIHNWRGSGCKAWECENRTLLPFFQSLHFLNGEGARLNYCAFIRTSVLIMNGLVLKGFLIDALRFTHLWVYKTIQARNCIYYSLHF